MNPPVLGLEWILLQLWPSNQYPWKRQVKSEVCITDLPVSLKPLRYVVPLYSISGLLVVSLSEVCSYVQILLFLLGNPIALYLQVTVVALMFHSS